MFPTRQDISYAAGLFDGEGCVNIGPTGSQGKRRMYRAQVIVASTDRPVLEWLQERWHGSIYDQKRDKPHHRLGWQWHLSESEALPFLETMRLHIKIKGPATDNGLQFLWLKRDNHKFGSPYSPEVIASLRELYERHKKFRLGHQQPRKTGESEAK